MSTQDVLRLSHAVEAAILYVVVGPDSTYFVVIDGRNTPRVIGKKVESIGGKALIGLLTGLSPTGPGLVRAQYGGQASMQASLDHLFATVEQMMTEVHFWLEYSGITDVAIVATGLYCLLPLAAAPVSVDGQRFPFCWLHRCTTLPSGFEAISERRALLQKSLFIVGEPARADLEKLKTRTECEGVRYICEGEGWRVRLRLHRKATSEEIRTGLEDASILHYAGHAKTDVFNPSNTALCLTDGDLRLEDIGRVLTGQCQLLVLSACQTGQMSSFRAPDENYGLA